MAENPTSADADDVRDDPEAVREVKESAAAMGVEDVEDKDVDEVVADARQAQADSQASPSAEAARHAEREDTDD